MSKVKQEIKRLGLENNQILVAALVVVLKNRFKGYSVNAILANVLATIARCLCIKRVKIKGVETQIYVNIYVINFAPSGIGKDRMLNDLESFFFPLIYSWYKDVINNYLKESNNYSNDKNKKRNIAFVVTNATPEGFFADAKALSEASFGTLYVLNSEIGNYLVNATQDQKLFLNQLYEAYMGKIVAKSIKTEQREPDIEDIPVVCLWHGDPTIFEKDFKKTFSTMMESGIARRSIITFMAKQESYEIEDDPHKAYEEEKKYYDDLKILGNYFFEIFSKIELNAIYELTEEAYATLHEYKCKLKRLILSTNQSILIKEADSREFKAFKISGIYAALSHPTEKIIKSSDMEQAIETVERLSGDFKTFINYKPRYSDKYDGLFEFFKENLNISFTKTELINKHYHEFGTSRDKARLNFEDYMDIIREIASNGGYFLDEQSINRNSGKSYTLKLIESKSLSPDVKPLDTLINNHKTSEEL